MPASAIANPPTPPAAPMPAELQSKPEDFSSENAGGCTTGGRAGLRGGSTGPANAGLARLAALRRAAAKVRVLRMALLRVGIARCDPMRRPCVTPVTVRPFAPTSDPFVAVARPTGPDLRC